MKLSYLFAFLPLIACPACTGPTRTTPTLNAPSIDTVQSDPPKPGILQQAGDTTWSIVTAPARLIPSKKPVVQEAPETYDAPGVTIHRRDRPGEPATMTLESVPPATEPAAP